MDFGFGGILKSRMGFGKWEGEDIGGGNGGGGGEKFSIFSLAVFMFFVSFAMLPRRCSDGDLLSVEGGKTWLSDEGGITSFFPGLKCSIHFFPDKSGDFDENLKPLFWRSY